MPFFRRRTQPLTEPPKPAVSALTPAEVAWREDQITAARLLAEHCTGGSEEVPSLERLDAVVDRWQEDRAVDVDILVNAVGIAFGQHLHVSTGLAWVIAADDAGSDLALHGDPGDLLVFPASTVARRVSTGESRFLERLHHEMATTITQVRGGPLGVQVR